MIAGRVALVTGANTGIGRVTALELARQGAQLFLACRSAERTRSVIDEIRAARPGALAEWLPLELSDFDSVRACARADAIGLRVDVRRQPHGAFPADATAPRAHPSLGAGADRDRREPRAP